MTITRLTAIPATITAGDTVGVTLSLSDYPAPTWSLNWALAGVDVLDKDSTDNTDDGTSHDLDLTAVETAALGAGNYSWRLRVTDGTTVRTYSSGILLVQADLGEMAAGEALSYEETTLSIIEAALTNTLTSEMKSYLVQSGGSMQQVGMIPPLELLRIRDDFKARIAVQRGEGFGAPIRFGYRGLGSC